MHFHAHFKFSLMKKNDFKKFAEKNKEHILCPVNFFKSGRFQDN
jgi:hypothetical protein